ncbi:MAG: FG-GAP repeat domain-containing protein, partial [Bacteroidales bacterium]
IILEPFVLGSEGGGHGIAFGDVNNNGREDLLREIGWYERPEGDPFAGPWRLHPETDLSAYHPSCPFVTKDLNQDGRLDILFGRAHDYGIFWWEQQEPLPDGTTRWKEHVIDTSWSQVHLLKWADLDNDGSEELIAGKCIWAHNGKDPGYNDPPVVYYYKWDSSTFSFTRHTIAGHDEGIAMGRQISVHDLNEDGWLDIVSPAENGLWVLMNKGYAPDSCYSK